MAKLAIIRIVKVSNSTGLVTYMFLLQKKCKINLQVSLSATIFVLYN